MVSNFGEDRCQIRNGPEILKDSPPRHCEKYPSGNSHRNGSQRQGSLVSPGCDVKILPERDSVGTRRLR